MREIITIKVVREINDVIAPPLPDDENRLSRLLKDVIFHDCDVTCVYSVEEDKDESDLQKAMDSVSLDPLPSFLNQTPKN